jgi:NADPH:quinone reductase-like Zn-dependent oxidoreductase
VGGAFAEFICLPASKVSKKPANVTFEQAAALALVGTTAHQCVHKISKVAPSSRILIVG